MALPWALFLGVAAAQQIGTNIPEIHPTLTTQNCTSNAGCTNKNTSLVLDLKYRKFHMSNDTSISCATFPLNSAICPDAATCAKNCVTEGVDYQGNGVQSRGSALTLRQWLWNGTAYDKVSPRVYLLDDNGKDYVNLTLLGKEFSFDVDMSELGCGMNAAVYTGEMPIDGGRSDGNPGGAAYGHGYCDAQCYKTPWFNGAPNLNQSGACCAEMDFWEANSMATVYTPHTCSGVGSFPCNGTACDHGGVCDKSGCGLNPYMFGAKDYYGPGKTVDTTRPFTVVTQFRTADGSSTLNEIRQLYVQDGNIIDEPKITTVPNPTGTITSEFCSARNASDFNRLGGLENFGKSLARGHVLIFSLWASDGDFMNWLDSTPDSGGPARGPCSKTEGDPKQIIQKTPKVEVTFSNIRWGDIGSTYNASGPPGSNVSRSAAVRFAASDGKFGAGGMAFLSSLMTILISAMMFAWL